ncbi:hypothetical protein BJ986_002702 [Phycicoccus badiiscoriae]|uniref:HNH nuclease domain-containing protein n=1 Tax=Pedococcus badiiscoriae TaxID=642776 RepID=A0A852WPQ9_9MICO|nr:HNH endonuclease signature motif containing protein [Pedococcus badiiscoriae]NYG08215.1 hypothetical protein [Pedococcus badiiscoriae]
MEIAADTGQERHAARPVLGAVTSAIDALATSSRERLWALADGELGQTLTLLGRLRASVDAHLVSVLAEAKLRGLGSGDGWGPVDWARAMAPQLPTRTLTDLDAVAGAADEPRLTEVTSAVAAGAADDSTQALPVGKAAQIVRFHRSVRGLADPDQLAELTAILLHSARGPDGLPERDLATALRRAADGLRPDRHVEHDADLRRAHRSLVKGPGPLGLSRYTLLLDDEGASIVDAAVDAVAKPSPDPETGARDERTPAARRADALIDLVTRAVSAPEGVPRQAKTSVLVTVDVDTLTRRTRGAGLTLTGELLTTETIRRMACDAEVIPMILGSRGEVLDHGTAVRLFTTAQIRHLWLRDRGCTFPGCTRPPRWADAHHLIHWADGGPTDLSNAALLCRAHHTVVHRGGYAAVVLDGPRGPTVQWELAPGSYDHRLEALRRAGTIPRWPDEHHDPDHDPP